MMDRNVKGWTLPTEEDGTPILITMKTEHIWVPLEVLAIEGQRVLANLFLLADQPVYT